MCPSPTAQAREACSRPPCTTSPPTQPGTSTFAKEPVRLLATFCAVPSVARHVEGSVVQTPCRAVRGACCEQGQGDSSAHVHQPRGVEERFVCRTTPALLKAAPMGTCLGGTKCLCSDGCKSPTPKPLCALPWHGRCVLQGLSWSLQHGLLPLGAPLCSEEGGDPPTL